MKATLLSRAALVAALCAALGACKSSSGGERDESTSEALDRLRDRISETDETDDAVLVEDDEAGADRVEEGPPDYFHLEPRYFGALPDDDERVLGVYRFRAHPDPFIDGDTVGVAGLDASIRMDGFDTEEVLHGHSDRRLRMYSDFEGYAAEIYAENPGLPKYPTPLGELAQEYARQFFSGDTEVRLEFDELTRTRGYFSRYLVYVYGLREGGWVNYNIESVRAGMSPYFTKYGYSARFHEEFLEAEAEARAAQRGIWDPELRHYPDYETRRLWWDQRAEAIAHYRSTHGDDPTYFEVSADPDWQRLWEYDGQTITVFGTIGDRHFDWDPPRINISHRRGDDFQLVGFRDGVFDSVDWESFVGGYVYVRGRLGFYNDHPQFVVDRGVEVWTEP